MGRTACTELQWLYSTAIHLLLLWVVRPVQSFSDCTVELYLYSPYGPYGLYRASVSVQYSYTSTPTMGCTACTEPQCLYSVAIPLLPLWAVRPVQSFSDCTGCTLPFFYLDAVCWIFDCDCKCSHRELMHCQRWLYVEWFLFLSIYSARVFSNIGLLQTAFLVTVITQSLVLDVYHGF